MARNNRQPRRNNQHSSVKLLQRPDNGLGAFADASADAFLMFDENLNLVSINPAGERMLGISKEAVEGKNILTFAPEIRKTGRYDKYLGVMKTGNLFFVEEPFSHPKFGDMHLSIKAFKVREGLGMIVNDITEHRKSKETLRRSEEYFRNLIENAQDAMVIVGGDGTIAYGSPSIEHMLGYKTEELIGTDGLGFAHPDDMPQVMNDFAEVTKGPGAAVHTELRIRHKDGSWRVVEAVASNLLDNQAIKGIVVNWRDVTERRRMEEDLRQSELLAIATIEGMSDGVVLVGMDGKVTYINKAFEKMLGYKAEELIGRSAVELPTYQGSKDKKKAREALLKVIGKGETEPIDMVGVAKDGTEIPISFSASVIKDAQGNPKTLVAVIRDITERKKAEELLKLSEEYFRALMDNYLDAITIIDDDGTIRYESLSYKRLLGFKPEERVNSNILERIHPDDINRVAELFAEFIPNRGGTLHTEVRAQHKDGSWRFIEAIGSNLLDNPIVKGIVVNLRDINERKMMEDALKESEERFRRLVDQAPDIIFRFSAEKGLEYCSPIVLDITGYTPEELILEPMVGLELAKGMDLGLAEDYDRAVVKGASIRRREISFKRKDGRQIYLEMLSHAVRDKEGKVIAYEGILRDVTERKRMEEEVYLLSDAVRMTTDSVAITDMSGRILDINEAGLRLYGLSDRADFVGRNPLDAIAPEDQREAIENMAKIMETGQVEGIQYHVVRKDGSRILIETSVSLIKDYEGNPKGLVAVARDITDRKLMEEALKQSEKKYRQLFENMQEGLWLIDKDSITTFVNPRMAEILGYTAEEMLGKHLFKFMDERGIEVAKYNLERRRQGIKEQHDFEFMRKDGAQVYASMETSPITDEAGNYVGALACVADITERKKAQEELEENRERLDIAVEASQIGVWELDLISDTSIRNLRHDQIFGYEEALAEWGAKIFFEHIIPEDRPSVKAAFDKAMKTGKLFFECRIIWPDESIHWITATAKASGDSTGKPMKMLGTVLDVTEHKKADEDLRRSEEKLRRYLESSPDAIYINDLKANFIYGNGAAERLIGYSKEEIIGKSFLDLGILPPEHMLKAAQLLELNAVGKPTGPDEFELIRKDGSHVWVEICTYPIGQGDDTEVIGIARDITERKRMEQQLQSAGRLAAVGELAAGVAHELNNPLAAIQGYAQLLTLKNDLDELTKKDVETIYREALRASKITKNLLSFARRHEPEKRYISINETVEKTLELGAHQMKVNNIELVKELQPDLPSTMADFYQLQQVFMNIAMNAEQAMAEAHGRGKFIVKTQKSGDVIQVSFVDDGPGISEENLKRIFDPFFTTKDVGKGTGLGLSICYGIIEAHKGRLYARSKLGEGASFFVEIPIISDGQQGQGG